MTLTEFLKAHPVIRNDLTFPLPAPISLKKLSGGINESSILKNMYSLTWLVCRYSKILNGYYKDRPGKLQPTADAAAPGSAASSAGYRAPVTGSERTYSAEDYKNMFIDFEDVEF